MTDEEIVAALAEAMVRRYVITDSEAPRRALAAALLPTVRRVAEQRAAEELLAAADDPVSSLMARTAEFGLPSRVITVGTLRARAAALTATPNHGTDTTT